MNSAHLRKEESSREASLTVQQLALTMALFAVLALTLQAAQPAWWTATGGPLNSNAPNDYVAANQGQLKQFTQKAVTYMDGHLTNSAETTLDSMVLGWSNYYQTNGYSSTNPAPADFKVVNQGQLKTVANLVYTSLSAGGYMTTNFPTWTQTNASDYKVANLGQLKQVFDFELLPPQTPTNLATQLSGTSATLSWTDPVINVQTYTIQYSINGGTTWTTYGTVAGNVTSATLTGLTLGLPYSFRVTASNSSGSSSPSTNDAAPLISLVTPSGTTLVP